MPVLDLNHSGGFATDRPILCLAHGMGISSRRRHAARRCPNRLAPVCRRRQRRQEPACIGMDRVLKKHPSGGSEEHTSELQSLMSISYAVFCLKNKRITEEE